jgi:hypothetical protein
MRQLSTSKNFPFVPILTANPLGKIGRATETRRIIAFSPPPAFLWRDRRRGLEIAELAGILIG